MPGAHDNAAVLGLIAEPQPLIKRLEQQARFTKMMHDRQLELQRRMGQQMPDARASKQSGYVVFYRVHCADHESQCHRQIYRTEPSILFIGTEPHLGGESIQLDMHMDNAAERECIPAFIFYRTVHCSSSAQQFNLSGPPAPPRGSADIVAVLSEELHAVLRKLTLFSPAVASYARAGKRAHLSPSVLSSSPMEYSRFFFYHHREALQIAVMADFCPEDLKRLWSYLQRHPDPLSAKCDEQFGRGEVSSETLPWLFRPNEVIVSREGGHAIAYVLRGVLKAGRSTFLELNCWNWGYIGNALYRRDRTLKLTSPMSATIPIRQLAAYPLRFADAETKARLLERGQRFWGLRNQTYASYEGVNYSGD